MTKAIKTLLLYRYRREVNFWKPYYQLHLKASLWEKQSLREVLCLELKQTSVQSLLQKQTADGSCLWVHHKISDIGHLKQVLNSY